MEGITSLTTVVFKPKSTHLSQYLHSTPSQYSSSSSSGQKSIKVISRNCLVLMVAWLFEQKQCHLPDRMSQLSLWSYSAQQISIFQNWSQEQSIGGSFFFQVQITSFKKKIVAKQIIRSAIMQITKIRSLKHLDTFDTPKFYQLMSSGSTDYLT